MSYTLRVQWEFLNISKTEQSKIKIVSTSKYNVKSEIISYTKTGESISGDSYLQLELQDLTSEELNEIIEYYSKKGYILNQIDNIVIRDSDAIIIEWSNPIKQNLREKLYILKFSCSKLKKLFNINKFKNTFLRTIVLTFKDFYWYYFWNDSYCVNATRLYRKTLKSRKYIEKRNKTS